VTRDALAAALRARPAHVPELSPLGDDDWRPLTAALADAIAASCTASTNTSRRQASGAPWDGMTCATPAHRRWLPAGGASLGGSRRSAICSAIRASKSPSATPVSLARCSKKQPTKPAD